SDIQLLLNHYLESAAIRSSRPNMEFSPEALEALTRYRWPGNVRELRNLCERMAVLSPHDIVGLADLPAECRSEPRHEESAEYAVPFELGAADNEAELQARKAAIEAAVAAPKPAPAAAPATIKLADVERAHILGILEAADNNKKLAAERLGID